LGALFALGLYAPAAWLSDAMARMTQGRVLLIEPQGTVWHGQATLGLGSGPDSPGVATLPGRVHWHLGLVWPSGFTPAVMLHLEHPSMLSQPLRLHLMRQAGGWQVALQPGSAPGIPTLQAPASWLTGLGAPWNTLQPSGRLSLEIQQLQWGFTPGAPPSAQMALRLVILNAASRVSTLPVLGHYEFTIQGGPDMALALTSRAGSSLLLEGQGRWTPGRQVEFRGQASAAPGREEALSNLLNIIGRREGARSIIALGRPAEARPATAPLE
jgi:general secretion pathway protein N